MPSRKSAFALLLAVPVFLYIVYPLGAMLSESLSLPVAEFRARQMGWDPHQQPPGAGLRRAFDETKTRDAIWGTLRISVASAITAGAWGLTLSLLWSRREFPGRKVFAALGLSPVLMPPIVGTLAFYSLVGETGALWRIFPSVKPWITPFYRVLLVHTYSFGCFTFAYVSAALEDANVSREDAARSLGAGRVKTFFAATWPVIRAPLLAAALLTFMASAASFSAPYMLDNTSRYLTVEIYNEAADPGMQRSLSVILAAFSLAALPIFLFFSRRTIARSGVDLGLKGDARRGLRTEKFSQSVGPICLSAVAALILLAPPAMVAAGLWTTKSAYPYSGWVGAFGSITREDFATLLRSLKYGAIVAVLDVIFAATMAAVLRSSSGASKFPVEFGIMLAMALPGSSVAIALLSAFNAPSILAFGAALGGTQVILILAYIIRTLPLSVRAARAAFDALGDELELAAAGLGASRARSLFKITLPLVFPSLLAGGLLCFVTASGEFVASLLLATATTQPVSVRMNEVWRTDSRTAHALAICLMLACGAVALLSRAVGLWRLRSSAAAIRNN